MELLAAKEYGLEMCREDTDRIPASPDVCGDQAFRGANPIRSCIFMHQGVDDGETGKKNDTRLIGSSVPSMVARKEIIRIMKYRLNIGNIRFQAFQAA